MIEAATFSAEAAPHYRGAAGHFTRWLADSQLRVEAVTPAVCRRYLDTIVAEATRAKHLSALRQAFRALLDRGALRWSPFEGLPAVSVSPSPLCRDWPPLLGSRSCARESRDQRVVAAVRYTHFTLSELASIRVSDVDGGEIHVPGLAHRRMPVHPQLGTVLRGDVNATQPGLSTPLLPSLGRGHWRGALTQRHLTRTNLLTIVLAQIRVHTPWASWADVCAMRAQAFAELDGPTWRAGFTEDCRAPTGAESRG